MRKVISPVIMLLLLTNASFANIRLPAVISSGMVLQQQSNVTIWGWANPGEKIFVTPSWSGETDSTTATNGATWKIIVKTPEAGGPFTIHLKGDNDIMLDDVMTGEVWICSGQSNMEWSSLNGVQDMETDLPACTNPQIRFFHIPKTAAFYPQDDCKAHWESCTPESLKSFSAVGYYFGKRLFDSLHVPIGLINASWGGTPAETWTPAEVVQADEDMKRAADSLKEYPWWPSKPGATYNGMIAPVKNFAIAGAIWYQGEANVGTYKTYALILMSLIDSWRKAWNEDFPFYFVQIAPFDYGNKNFAAFLREQQTSSLIFPNTGMVVVSDLVDDVKNIHPKNKKDVGNRLANYALAETYHHNGFAYKSPVYKRMVVNNDKAEIYFDNAPKGFVIKGDKATEWYIAGDDQQFLPAEVKLEKDRIIVFNKQIKNPIAVRYSFTNTAIGNTFSKEGLPLCSFRTDFWPE